MILFIVSILWHPAFLVYHVLHELAGEIFGATMQGALQSAIPDLAGARVEALFAEAPEWADHASLLGGTDAFHVDAARRLQGVREQEAYEDGEIPWAQVIPSWAGGLILNIIIVAAIAFCYKTGITDKRQPWQGCPPSHSLSQMGGRFKYDTFQCCDNTQYTLYGCCCLASRLGDTYTMTNVSPNGFWTYIVFYEAIYIVGQVLGLVWVIIVYTMDLPRQTQQLQNVFFYGGQILFAIWLAGKRKELRRALDDPNPDGQCAMDFCCYWWCACCTAIQEARQVDEATNTTIVCWMKLVQLNPVAPAAVVGQPVVGTVVNPADPKQGAYGNAMAT